jgi:hypothetical protein
MPWCEIAPRDQRLSIKRVVLVQLLEGPFCKEEFAGVCGK